MIKILFVNHGLYYGGATASLFLLIKSLHEYSVEAHLRVTSCRSDEMKMDFLNYCESVEEVDPGQIYHSMAASIGPVGIVKAILKSSDELIKDINELGIQIVHFNTTVFPHVLKRVRQETEAKIITHVREMFPEDRPILRQYMINQIGRYSDCILAISDNEAKPFSNHSNVHVMPNPFDFASLDNVGDTFRTERGISEEQVLVGMMGQCHKGKGQLEFLKAIKIVLAKRLPDLNVRFVLIGVNQPESWGLPLLDRLRRSYRYYNSLMRYMKEHNLDDDTIVLPYSYDVFPTLKAMDIMVRPAISGDPWGRDIIESMAFAKPIIATGESEFYVQNGENGYLVPPSDPQAMAEKIIELALDKDRRLSLGASGAQRIRQMCDLSNYGKNLNECYESLVT
ncbi:hypothetical protein BVX97_05985 [bacterium E08(2017)]|nr:hypothetical protein BVX97_05985 [bacterium E08(2017)]